MLQVTINAEIFTATIFCGLHSTIPPPQKAESLKHVQAVLNFPELKVIKPSDTK